MRRSDAGIGIEGSKRGQSRRDSNGADDLPANFRRAKGNEAYFRDTRDPAWVHSALSFATPFRSPVDPPTSATAKDLENYHLWRLYI
jgi:hypothetical protein